MVHFILPAQFSQLLGSECGTQGAKKFAACRSSVLVQCLMCDPLVVCTFRIPMNLLQGRKFVVLSLLAAHIVVGVASILCIAAFVLAGTHLKSLS